ncbi:response regulator [Acidobacteria bacterium AB60]|nr:response regulator [Acidobacteria bacterium AB60]
MTTEPTQPQSDLGSSPANGQGQSQGHRRRRRRRKNKTSHSGAPQAQSGQGSPQGQATSAPPPPPQAQAAPPKSHGHQQQQRQGRKKKKFFQKGGGGGSNGAPAPQPGNSINAPQQSKRKNKQRGPREFVGPMDHSYRAVNGNVADAPASTIQITSNGHGSYYPDVYQAPLPPVQVRHDAPTRIYCFIEDLFFLAKIQETARKLGVKVEFVKGEKDVVSRLIDAPESERPRLLVFDLNNANAKPLTLIPKFKAKFKKATSVIGFLSHLQGDLKLKATEAGCDTVMPRSAFSQSLPNLLRRYGMEEEEEYIPQPV